MHSINSILLTTIEVSRVLDLSPDRIRQLARSGALPAQFSTGTGVRLFSPRAVENFRRKRGERKAK